MSVAKIKKHFSLFMVKKSIKKDIKDLNVKEIKDHNLEKQRKSEKVIKHSVPKFLNPCQYFHMKGDIFFIDKLNGEEIGLISPRNGCRAIGNMTFFPSQNLWSANFVNANCHFDSWSLVFQRLMTLGDQAAFKLASTIQQVLIPMELNMPSYQLPLESSPYFAQFCKEVDQFLSAKKDVTYLVLQYEVQSVEKGIVMTKMGFSKIFVELIWGDESVFLDFMLNHEMNDFITIERERYFEFVTHNIETIASKMNNVTFRLRSVEGTSTSISPTGIKKQCYDKNGNVVGLICFYEFPIEEEFRKRVAKSREKKTIVSKRKTMRENNLEKFLNLYYSNEEFCKKKSMKPIEIRKEDDELPLPILEGVKMKMCGFRARKENENNEIELLLS